ncbi:MAG: ABC transporter ATP-binding protein [Rhodothermales bacterium]
MTVDVHHLIKRYGEHFALQVPSLHLSAGEALGLVGNNGAGKTTFLRLLLDLIQADEGYALVGGENVAQGTSWKAHVGSYLDESFLLDFLTPDEFFRFAGHVYEMSTAQIDTSLIRFQGFLPDEALGRTQPFIRDLSMGNKKKIGLVAAMFLSPRLLILDEPFANLDPGSQIRLKKHLHQLRQEHGTTMLISSHDLGHVTDVCERIAVLDNGRIVRDMTTSDATLQELKSYFTAAD